MRHRHLGKFLLSTAVVCGLATAAVTVPQTARADVAQPSPSGCAGMTVPEENHASIRLGIDQPASGAQVSVNEQGQIAVGGILHKHATMVDVSDEQVATADFTLGPPPDGVAAWAVSWSTSLRPPHLGENRVCVRAERDPKRTARILRSFSVVDLIPPSNVSGLTVGDITSTTAVLSWDAATDNYGLAGYEVSIDGGPAHRTTVGTRSFTVTGLAPSTDHIVSVVAIDLAGNLSTTPATASFTTTAPPPPPPPPNGNLTITPEQGGATATWQPDPATDASYQAFLDGQLFDEFPLDQYCQDADGNPASPCTAQDMISFVIDPLEEGTPHTFRVDAIRADGTTARSISGSFTTTTSTPLISADTRQMDASETSRCAAMGGDFYIAASIRAEVPIPGGSTQIFDGCYKAANSSCIRGFLPPSGNKVINCSDDVTTLLTTLAPPGRGPIISSMDSLASPGAARPALLRIPTQSITWCEEEACALLLAAGEEAAEVSTLATVAAAAATFIVVAAEGIGIGVALSALLAIFFPTPIAIDGVLEYPISPDTDFDTFTDWGESQGEWYNSLKLYAEVVKTTKELASTDGIPFTWNDEADSLLKIAIDQGCTAQHGGNFPSGCDTGFAVYVPGGVNYMFRPMNQTGAHIVAAIASNGGLPQPPGRAIWYYPARSIDGQAARKQGFKPKWYDKNPLFNRNACTGRAKGMTCDEFPFWTTNQAVNLSGLLADLKPVPTTESLPQASDVSGFYNQCHVNDNERFIVLPIKPWVDAGGPSFGFRVSDGGASICMAPRPRPAP